MSGHRWSGWPGAWCLDCGAEDPWEQALADNRIDFIYCKDAPDHPEIVMSDETRGWIEDRSTCPEPGSKRHDPYERAKNAKP